MSPRRNTRNYLLLTALMLLASCKGAEKVCAPTDPLCGGGGGGGGGATVTNIVVTSPINTAMAVGRTAQLSASATDASGNAVAATFTWTSSNGAAATVNANGLVSAIGSGTTNIQASASGVTGSLSMRAVDADLPGITTALSDPFVQVLRGGLDAATASTLSGFFSTCSSRVTTGDLLAIDVCLQGAQDTNGVNGTDDAILAVLALFLEHAQRLLNL